MKNKILILVFLFSGIFLWPFGCDGQTKTLPVDPDGCDTVFIESPEIQKCAEDLLSASNRIDVLTNTIQGKNAEIEGKAVIIADLNATIVVNENVINGLNQDNSIQADIIAAKDVIIGQRDETIVQLEADLAVKPETEIVYVEKDSITVGGIDYKVSDIEIILPAQSIDTVYLNSCYAQVDENKIWYHSGSIDVYPHIINFPTKELSMTAIQFNEPLTEDMKKYQTRFKVQRIRNHQDATTKYVNLFVDPSEYLPQD